MRTLKHLTTWLLLLTVFLASGVVSAKVASGDQNRSWTGHQAEGVVNWLTHQGKSARSTTGPPGSPVATKRGSDFVDGYRAVSKAEADDIAKHGFRPDPSGRSMQDKWFSESREGAEQFRKTYSDLTEIVHTKVPKNVYDRSYKHSNIDNTGPGFCVQCNDLPLLPKPK